MFIFIKVFGLDFIVSVSGKICVDCLLVNSKTMGLFLINS